MDNPLQQTPEWLHQRLGHLTASRMADAVATLRNGEPSKACTDYALELASERLTGLTTEHFVNPAMLHGIENEPLAIDAFEQQSGEIVTPCGFIKHPEIQWFGASPDGMLGQDGLVEVKCPKTETFLGYKMSRGIPEQYCWQMMAQLACTRRRYCLFIAFDPRILIRDQRLVVIPFEPKAELIQIVEAKAIKFLKTVDEILEKLK